METVVLKINYTASTVVINFVENSARWSYGTGKAFDVTIEDAKRDLHHLGYQEHYGEKIDDVHTSFWIISDMKKSRRIQVAFDERAAEMLERLQASTGGSVAEVVRHALGFYDWAREHVTSGKDIAVVDHEKNRVREYLLPFRKDAKNDS